MNDGQLHRMIVYQIEKVNFYFIFCFKFNFRSNLDDLSVTSFKSNENHLDSQDISNSTSLKKSMIVAVNGRFDMQDEDDYIAKHHVKSSNDEKNRNLFLPTPPREPKQKQDSIHRPFSVRPKSSSDKKSKTEATSGERPKRF
jgi:hypothetical protein